MTNQPQTTTFHPNWLTPHRTDTTLHPSRDRQLRHLSSAASDRNQTRTEDQPYDGHHGWTPDPIKRPLPTRIDRTDRWLN